MTEKLTTQKGRDDESGWWRVTISAEDAHQPALELLQREWRDQTAAGAGRTNLVYRRKNADGGYTFIFSPAAVTIEVVGRLKITSWENIEGQDHDNLLSDGFSLPEPLPDNLHQAFKQALAAFENWDRRGDEPLVSLDQRQYSLAGIIDQVAKFPDVAPGDIYTRVTLLAKDFREEGIGHACEGPKDKSYASIARCLLCLLSARQAHYAALKRQSD